MPEENNAVELKDEDLEKVTGGDTGSMNFPCPKCGGHGTAFFANIMRGEVHNNEETIAVMIMICLLAFSFSAGAGNTNKNTADLVVYGTIYTDEDGDNEIVEAFAVKDGKEVSEGTVPIDT